VSPGSALTYLPAAAAAVSLQLAPELHAELAGSSLLVFKGDLNYR
jgi:hypothetical protein